MAAISRKIFGRPPGAARAVLLLGTMAAAAAPTAARDIADLFPGLDPGLELPPLLAAAAVEESTVAAHGDRGWSDDFAALVEEAKREAVPSAFLDRRTVAAFASLRMQPAPAGGPQPRPSTAAPRQPPAGPVRPAPQTNAVPLPAEIQGENAVPPQLPPDVQANLNRFARADVGGIRENWSDAPNLVGDGCAPTGAVSRIPVGRLCIIAPGLAGSPLSTDAYAAQLNVLTQGKFNSVQAIQAGGYPIVLPVQPLGPVAGTPPTTLPAGPSPGPGIVGVGSPALFLAAADNAFATDPNLNTGQYATLQPTTVYDAANSGALPADPQTGAVDGYDAFLFYNYVVDVAVSQPGSTVGFVKMTENQSPIPRDRVYMTYSYFHNANFYATKADINRFMPGFEKTFYDGWTSVEIRTPFAATLSNTQTVATDCAGISEYRDIQFGNMSVIFKTLIWERNTWAMTCGMQVMLPTANNTYLNGFDTLGQPMQLVYVANESVHLMPFVGAIWAPNERFFNQILIQYEKDANGNLAYVNNNFETGISGRQLTQAGRIFFPDFLYVSFGTGYWLYKDNTRDFTGFAPIMEIHVNQGLNAFEPLHQAGFQLGPDLGVVSVTNAMVGCNFEWGERSTLTFGYVTPLGGGVDRYFDGELRALFNWRFGQQNRLTRAQF